MSNFTKCVARFQCYGLDSVSTYNKLVEIKRIVEAREVVNFSDIYDLIIIDTGVDGLEYHYPSIEEAMKEYMEAHMSGIEL
jgi:anion-transporting  ArsA/GET3 family ATPase